MKLKRIDTPEVFKPIRIELTIEDEVEYTALLDILKLNATIPTLCDSPNKQMIVRQFIDQLRYLMECRE